MQLYEILRRPLVTEKYTFLQTQNKYAFEVAMGANKPQIKQAVEKAYNVHVTSVNVINVRDKTRMRGRMLLPAHPWKKAIVTLKAGDKIEIFAGT